MLYCMVATCGMVAPHSRSKHYRFTTKTTSQDNPIESEMIPSSKILFLGHLVWAAVSTGVALHGRAFDESECSPKRIIEDLAIYAANANAAGIDGYDLCLRLAPGFQCCISNLKRQ